MVYRRKLRDLSSGFGVGAMSFATSRPVVNRFFGGVDVGTAMRTHLLANAGNRNRGKHKQVALAVATAVRVHPTHIARVMRRCDSFVQDLIN